nr:hypothetical protein [Tanacetum cinerariifolium]
MEILLELTANKLLVVFTLKRSRDDKDKDQDPSAGSDRGKKKEGQARKLSHLKIQGQRKRSLQAHLNTPPTLSLLTSLPMQRSQFIKLMTRECNNIKSSTWTWISQVARAKEPPTSFDELMDTSFDFSTFVLNRLNIKDPTQENLSPVNVIYDKHAYWGISHWGPKRQHFYGFAANMSSSKDSPVNVIYDKHAYWGISHWGPKFQHFYGFAANMSSSKDVYSRKQIIVVTRLTIMKKYDYIHLEEIELTNLIIDKLYDLNVALHMFTRRIVIQRRVEDLQLGVESYQKKLNLTKPDTFRSNLRNRTTYTAYSDPKGVIYKDQNNKNRLIRADELHKFSDGMLNDVRTALHDIAKGIRMEYLPKRIRSGLEN